MSGTATAADLTVGADLEDVRPGLDRLLDDDTRALLDRWRQRFSARPRSERRRLLILALEREQIVSFAYGEDVLAARIAELDVPEELRRLGRTTVSRTWREADRRVVFAKATTDPVEWGHLCLSRLEGTGGRIDETMHIDRLTDFRSATMMVLDLAPPDLAIVDAWGPVADGPVGVMGSHRPCHPRRVYAGADAIAVDLAVLADMACPDPSRRPFLLTAAQWLGVDLEPPVVHGSTGRWQGATGGRPPHPGTAWSARRPTPSMPTAARRASASFPGSTRRCSRTPDRAGSTCG